MERNERITLVMVCDNHLIVMLAVLLKSIEKNNPSNAILDIYIVSDGIHKKNIHKINKTINSQNIVLHWKTMMEAVPENIVLPRDKSTFPLCAYARLCVPYFLPLDIKRAIYLDADMIVMKDISALWKVDIGDRPVGGVLDRSRIVSSSWAGIPNYEELGIAPDTKYFNSGLLIMNLDEWRRMNAAKLVIEAVNQNYKYVVFPDQYGLNVVFANKWYELDARWNSYPQDLTPAPYLIHFTGVKPIFKSYNSNPEYRKIFYELVEQTPWAGFNPKSDFIRLSRKAYHLMLKKFRFSSYFTLKSLS